MLVVTLVKGVIMDLGGYPESPTSQQGWQYSTVRNYGMKSFGLKVWFKIRVGYMFQGMVRFESTIYFFF